jgi:hypothetical protein
VTASAQANFGSPVEQSIQGGLSAGASADAKALVDSATFHPFTATDSGWRHTLSSAAMGVAGAAAAVGLSSLAFYAYQKIGTDPSILVDPATIKEIGQQGVIKVHTALQGLGQIQNFLSDVVNAHGANSNMGDFFDQLQSTGVDPKVFKDAVMDQAGMIGGQNNALWADRLLDPQTPLSPMAQYKISEVVWYHDKEVALGQANAADALVFIKTGLSVAAAAITSAAASNAETIKGFLGHMKGCAKRLAVDCGLIDDVADRQIRKTIKASAFDPVEARARLACEYTERQTPMYRSCTLHWLDCAKEQNRAGMLHLFGMEPLMVGKHTAIGQAVMIDHFCAKELRTLANQDPEYGKTLLNLADRRERLEKQGTRPSQPFDASGETLLDLPLRSIGEMVEETVDAQRRRDRAAALA